MYAQVEKPKENKSRAVANSVVQKMEAKQGFGFEDNRQKAKSQIEMQAMINSYTSNSLVRKMQGNTLPAQMYTIRRDGHKESENGEMLLKGKKDLYVSETMKEQANSIPHSQVRFEDLPYQKENSNGEELTAIWPKIREGGELDRGVKHFKGKPHSEGVVLNQSYMEETNRLMEMRKETLFEKTASENMRIKLEKSVEDWEEDSYEYEEEIKEEIKKLANEQPQLLSSQKKYNQNVNLAAAFDGDILPSDCGVMSRYVSGEIESQIAKRPGKTDVSDLDPSAGQTYHLTPNLAEETSDQNLWGSHHAAIIMADGSDHVTLEGAKQKTTDDFAKATFDTSWYFSMYGSDEGQSFGEAYQDSFAEGFEVTKSRRSD